MIYASAEALSTSLLPEEVAANWLYPNISRIRDVSVIVTRGVIRAAQKDSMDRELALRNISDEELDDYIRTRMYDPFTEVSQNTAHSLLLPKTPRKLANHASSLPQHLKVEREIQELASHFNAHISSDASSTAATNGSRRSTVTSRPGTANGRPRAPTRGQNAHGDALTTQTQ